MSVIHEFTDDDILFDAGCTLDLSPAGFEALANHPVVDARTGVAINPGTPTSILVALARDEQTAHAAAGNPSLPVEEIRRLATVDAATGAVATNPSVPLDVLLELSCEDDLRETVLDELVGRMEETLRSRLDTTRSVGDIQRIIDHVDETPEFPSES